MKMNNEEKTIKQLEILKSVDQPVYMNIKNNLEHTLQAAFVQQAEHAFYDNDESIHWIWKIKSKFNEIVDDYIGMAPSPNETQIWIMRYDGYYGCLCVLDSAGHIKKRYHVYNELDVCDINNTISYYLEPISNISKLKKTDKIEELEEKMLF